MNTIRLLATVVVSSLLAGFAPAATAQSADRAGHWDAHFNVLYGDSQNVSSNDGSSADIDSSAGWGFGFGYSFDDHWQLEGNFSYRNADYHATIAPQSGNPNAPQSISGTMEASTLAVNATYHFLARAFTPFVTGGVGGTYVDTNIPDGLAVPVCWWDPWWGYYCAPVYPTKSDTYFSYNVGAGLRWDARGGLFMRALVSEQWVDVGGGVGTPDFLQFRLDIGTRF